MSDRDPMESRLRRYLQERATEPPPLALEDGIRRILKEQPGSVPVFSLPRQLIAAAAIAALGVGLAAGVAYLRHAGIGPIGPASSPSPPMTINALSIGTNGGGDWVVARSIDIGSNFPQRRTGNVLYHTSDGGRSWQARLNFTGVYEGMSWSTDRRTGVVWTSDLTTPCGPAARSCNQPSSRVLTVYSTADGGFHWSQHAPSTFGSILLTFFSRTDGWALSRHDYIQGQAPTVPELFRTTDAGASWTKVSELPELNGMQLSGGIWGHLSGVGETNLEFADTQHGWLATGLEGTAGHSGLLETTDGGKTWHRVTVEAPRAMAGKQLVLGYPVLLSGGHALLPVVFGQRTDPNNFSISHRYIYSSSDGGSTWANPRPLRADAIEPTGSQWQNFYLDADHWWFTTINQRSAGEPVPQAGPGVARTTDGGKTWQVFASKDAPTILQMTFTDVDHGWALAVTGPTNTNILLRTTDGGVHWERVKVP